MTRLFDRFLILFGLCRHSHRYFEVRQIDGEGDRLCGICDQCGDVRSVGWQASPWKWTPHVKGKRDSTRVVETGVQE